MVKKLEGYREKTYDDGTGTKTIGYGHTGPDVHAGKTITKAEADKLLDKDLQQAAQAVDTKINVHLNQNQKDALTSFAFNVGAGALGKSTLRERLNKGEDPNTVIKEELPRWNKAGGKEL